MNAREGRGAIAGLLSFFQLAVRVGIVCGILIALIAGGRSWTWRILLEAGPVPGLILIFGMLAMPKSPARLHHSGRPSSVPSRVLRWVPVRAQRTSVLFKHHHIQQSKES